MTTMTARRASKRPLTRRFMVSVTSAGWSSMVSPPDRMGQGHVLPLAWTEEKSAPDSGRVSRVASGHRFRDGLRCVPLLSVGAEGEDRRLWRPEAPGATAGDERRRAGASRLGLDGQGELLRALRD